MPVPENVTMVAVDGTDALAYVIIRPGEKDAGGVVIEAASSGMSKEAAAYVLRHVAEGWKPAADHAAEAVAEAQQLRGAVRALRLVVKHGDMSDGTRSDLSNLLLDLGN